MTRHKDHADSAIEYSVTESSPLLNSRFSWLQQQEAFEKCWAHSPLRATTCRTAIHQVSLLLHAATVARRLRIDVHNDDDDDNNNDNMWQR